MVEVKHEVANGAVPKPANRVPGKGRVMSPEQFEALAGMIVNNAMGLRARTWAALLDPRRDLDAEFGYPPDATVIGPEFYRQLYERDAVANRAVQLMPKECWARGPKIRERAAQKGSASEGTAFERGLTAINRSLRPGLSWHRPEEADECPALNEYWERLDILAGIGSCGILLLGVGDGKGLHEPLDGVAKGPDGWARNGELEQEIRNLENIKGGIVENDYNPPPAQDPIPAPNGLPVQTPRRNPWLVTRQQTAALNAQEKAIVDGWRQEKARVENAQRSLEEQGVLAPGGAQAFSLNELWGWVRQWGALRNAPADMVVNAWATASGDETVMARWETVKSAAAMVENAPKGTDAVSAWGNWSATYGPGSAGIYPPAESTQYWDWLGGVGTTPTGSPAWSSHGFPAPWDAQGTGQPRGYGTPLGHAGQELAGDGNSPNRTQGMGGSPWQGIERQPLGTEAQYLGVQIGPAEQVADKPATKPCELLFVRPYSQDLFQVVRYEWNVRSPRFCQPVMYRVTLNDPRETSQGGVGLPLATVFVHWSRVVHYARLTDNAGASEIYAPPVLRPVLNNILAMRKVYGSSAEGYYRSGVPGYSFETDPALGGEPQIDVDENKDQIEQFINSAQKVLMLNGVSAKMLAPAIVDPTPHINIHLEALTIQLGCPMRVFKGSERGHLASGQDDEAWNERKAGRMHGLLTPRLIVATLDRLIACGALPPPDEGAKAENMRVLNAVRAGWAGKGLRAVRGRWGGWRLQGLVVNAPGEDEAEQGETDAKTSRKQEGKWKDLLDMAEGGYVVEWPDLEALGEDQKAAIAQQTTMALATFAGQVAQAGGMTWRTFYTEVLRWPAEKAEAALREAAEAQIVAAAMAPEQPQGGFDDSSGQGQEMGGEQEQAPPPEEGQGQGQGGNDDYWGDLEEGEGDSSATAGGSEQGAGQATTGGGGPNGGPNGETDSGEEKEPSENELNNLQPVGNEWDDEPFQLPAHVARALAAL